jgi:PAS domain S-box-containing protein
MENSVSSEQQKHDLESISKVQNFLNNAREGVLAVDKEGIIAYVNNSFSELLGRPQETIIGNSYQEILSNKEQIQSLEEAHMQTLKFLAETENKKKELVAKLKESQETFIKFIISFVKILESRDIYMQGHSARVARYAMILGKAAGLDQKQVGNLAYSGMFHDLGMINIPMDLIHKATILSPKEMLEVKKHPLMGVEYLKGIEIFKDVIPDILSHHERWDGAGYPRGLKGEMIPITGRILFIAEAFDAITSKRPYRMPRDRETAKKILWDNRNMQFDEKLVGTFIELIDQKVI